MAAELDAPDSFALADIREGELNVKVLKNGKKALIVKKGDDLHVFGEVCPHLGADLSEGRYCAKTGTLHCKWHGYVFSTDDGRFVENPNEKFMRILRTPTEHFKPEKQPRYRLAQLASAVKDGRLVIGKGAQDEARVAEGGQP